MMIENKAVRRGVKFISSFSLVLLVAIVILAVVSPRKPDLSKAFQRIDQEIPKELVPSGRALNN